MNNQLKKIEIDRINPRPNFISMVEFNGWVSISDSKLQISLEVLGKIEALIKSHELEKQTNLSDFGGRLYLSINALHNHDNYSESILSLLKQIGEIAPASYGVIYIRWLEDENLSDKFKVFKLAKQSVTIEEDTLLSPCSVVIGD